MTCPMSEAEIWVNEMRYGKGVWTGELDAGTYMIEVRREGYQPRSMVISVVANDERSYTLPEPTPIEGHAQIQSSPSEATIYIDGVEVGKTPHLHGNLSGGIHKVTIRMDGYQTYETEILIESSRVIQINANLIPIGSRGGVARSRDNAREPLAERRYDIARLREESVNLKLPTFSRNSIYLGGFYVPGELASYGVQAGVYVSNFNIQADFGIHDREIEGYWVSSGNSNVFAGSYQYIWKFDYSAAAKIGFGIRLAHSLRLTPQIGGVLTTLKSSKDDLYESQDDKSQKHTYFAGAQGALKLEWIPVKNLSVFASPNYIVPIQLGKIATLMDENNHSVSMYAAGFKVSLGVNLIF